jgi:hypothetical protein
MEGAIGMSVSRIWTLAIVVLTGGLTAALFWVPLSGAWWQVIRGVYYLPILLVSARHGAVAGLSAGLAVSLIYAIAADSRGMSDMAWVSILIPDFALVGLFGGGFLKNRRRFSHATFASGANTWPGFGRPSSLDYAFDPNPIDSILGAAGLLSEEDTPPEQRRELAGIISTECDHLSASIKGLLQFGSPATQSRFFETGFGEVIDAAIRETEFILGGRGIHVHKEFETDLLPVECDPEQIRNLLITLTINTAQSLPPGSAVFVDAHCADEGIVVNITDRGQESFLQRCLSRISSSRTGTTSLSLARAYDVVRQHGGRIRANCNARKRLEFSMWLPLHRKNPNDGWEGSGGGG